MSQYIKFKGAVYVRADQDDASDFVVDWQGRVHGYECIVMHDSTYPRGVGRRGVQYNGYVGVPPGHALYGKDYADAVGPDGDMLMMLFPMVELSYSEQGGDQHPVLTPDLWWFGFFEENSSAGQVRQLTVGLAAALQEQDVLIKDSMQKNAQ